MKKILLTLLVCCGILQHINAQRIEENKFDFSDGVTYSIKRFYSSKSSAYGDAGFYQTNYYQKGHKFKTVLIQFSNTTNSDVEIDFQKIFLIDKNNKKYDIHQVVQGMKITTTTENYKMILKAGKTRSVMAKFWPLFPNDEKIERMEVNGKPILLKEI